MPLLTRTGVSASTWSRGRLIETVPLEKLETLSDPARIR